MRRILKLVFVGGPAVFLLGVAGCQTADLLRVDAGFLDPSDVKWGEGSSAVEVRATKETGDNVEILTVHVEAVDSRGEILAQRSLDINQDQWGGGFVQAVQVDDDPELEIVAWGLHESNRTSFYLDYQDGAVAVQPFSLASETVRSRARERHQVHRVNGSGVGMLFFLGLVYYAIWGVIRVLDGTRSRATPPLPEGGTP